MHVLQSQRLIFREYTSDDMPRMLEIFSDPKTMAFWPQPYDEKGLEAWIEKNVTPYRRTGGGRLVTILKSTGEIIGDCGLIEAEIDGQMEFDLGYIIHHPHWGNGYGKEAAATLLNHGFTTLKFDRIVVQMPVEHKASQAVAESIGVPYEKSYDHPKISGMRMRVHALSHKEFTQQKSERLLDHMGGSAEKRNWLALAMSPDSRNRLIALETAVNIKDQIQSELLYLYSATRNNYIAFRILDLLDDEHRKVALPPASPKDIPRLEPDPTLSYYLAAQNDDERAILSYMMQTRQPMPEYKVQFLRLYMSRMNTTMKEARNALADLVERSRNLR